MCSEQRKETLQHSVRAAIQRYLADLDGESPSSLYEKVTTEIEIPLLETIMQHCDNNQSRTAKFLGMNRGTLRKKLRQHDIDY